MVWIAYCKVCKETVGWGDNPDTLLSMKHTSDEFEAKEKLDADGKPVMDGIRKVRMTVPKLHDVGVFEVAELPAKSNIQAIVTEICREVK